MLLLTNFPALYLHWSYRTVLALWLIQLRRAVAPCCTLQSNRCHMHALRIKEVGGGVSTSGGNVTPKRAYGL